MGICFLSQNENNYQRKQLKIHTNFKLKPRSYLFIDIKIARCKKIHDYHNDLNGLPEQLTDIDEHNVWQATYRVWGSPPRGRQDSRLRHVGKTKQSYTPVPSPSTPCNVYSQLIWVMTCYIRYTILLLLPTRPKVAPLSQTYRRIIAPLQYPF
ncbi:RHS protein [Pseudomonas mucidolens]|uniref:RHS protein n=1 Tax=Pseudomonas mucidolens TaxID=46679 RepID=A0A1H2N3Z2_9PSED|nr:RHS protein [Pseudomonas mucidolens]SQH32676.1 Rhs-family protein [Pseudomonas mucidolens]